MKMSKELKTKEDQNLKTPYHLLLNCPKALKIVALVMQHGNSKADRSETDWKEKSAEYFKEKAIRHIFQAQADKCDTESGLPHIAHAICNYLMMLEVAE